MFDQNCPKYVILGGGVSALSLAWFLKKKNPNSQITLIEKKDCLGGWIQTDQIDSFLFERGPHSLRLSSFYKDVCLDLFNDLNLSSKIIQINSAYKKRFLAYDNKLHPISLNPLFILAPQNFFKILCPILKGILKKTNFEKKDPSIAEFFNHYFGKFITQKFVDPFVMGVKGGNIHELSLKSSFSLLHQLSNKKGPLLFHLIKHLKKNKAELISFENGFSDLINGFKNKLDAQILLNENVTQLNLGLSSSVITSNRELKADHIFSTLPSYELAKLLERHSINNLNFLKNQKQVSYKVIYLGFSEKLNLPDSFGFISPSWSQQQISGTIFDSKIFPSQEKGLSQTRLSLMIHEDSKIFNQTEEEIKMTILTELQKLLKINLDPKVFVIQPLKKAISQYAIGHEEKLHLFKNELKEKFPNFTFLGNSFYGLSVPACIYKGYEIASHHSLITN